LPEDLHRDEIRRRQAERLRALLSRVQQSNAFWTRRWRDAGVNPADIRDPADLAKLPFTTKQDLVADQQAHPPYGTNLTFPASDYSRLHQTSGTTGSPLCWLDTPESWNWFLDCWGQIYRMAGVTRDDRLAFPFSFGPFLGFWAAFEGASRLGGLCLAGGGMSSKARLRQIVDRRATVVCCTPTYALRLAEVAADEGIELRQAEVRALIVAGEPGGSIPTIRRRIEEAWNARVFDHWGMTELGSLAAECREAPGGVHVLEGECIAEIIDPETGKEVAAGGTGELVVTNLGRAGSPLFRYRTGDLVEADARPCACGRALLRLKGGILGRVDDMFVIRGNNVYPSAIEAILRGFDDVAEYRIEVQTERAMSQLRVEIEPQANVAAQGGSARLASAVQRELSARLNFQPEVAAVAPGSLPRFELKGRRFVRNEEEAC